MPIYMKYEGIKGTGTGKYQDWIILHSCQIGQQQRAGNVIGGSEVPMKTTAVEITAVKQLADDSAMIARESINGKEVNIVIDFVKDGENEPYLSYQVENAMIVSYNISGNSSGENWETIIISFGKIGYSLKPIKLSHEPAHIKEKARWGMAIK